MATSSRNTKLPTSSRNVVHFHGTAEEDKIGKPASHGCIRLRNIDMLQLFDLVDIGTEVIIKE